MVSKKGTVFTYYARRIMKEHNGRSKKRREIVWDVLVGKAMGMLKVTACWHEIVFKTKLDLRKVTFFIDIWLGPP